MKRTGWLLASLLAGLVLGFAARMPAMRGLDPLIEALKPLGQLWLRALTMTLVPLVIALVANGVMNAVRHGQGGRLIASSFAVFLPLLALAVLMGWGVIEAILWLFPLGPQPLAGLIGAEPMVPHIPTLSEQLLAAIPQNPVAAAAQGQILPLVVFSMVLGFSLAKLPPRADGTPATLAALVPDLAHAMMQIVDWVLVAAPLGIFVLALGTAQGAGGAIAGLLAREVGGEIAVCLLLIVLGYGLVAGSGALPLARFARGILPAQATAAGTCSSMATAPITIECAAEGLALPDEAVGTVLPLAISTLRLASAAITAVEIFLAGHAAHVPAGPQWVLAGGMAMLSGIATPGLPGAAVIYASDAPGMQVLGAPLALIPLYIAASALPDIFITTANVTGQLTATTLVSGLQRRLGRGGVE